ncbi:hypothetical protein BC940DRAFT_292594 [Gongronella butleri]|nr:hypothetical protein BC940DRAFT_292594 [Gongronella butleri]
MSMAENKYKAIECGEERTVFLVPVRKVKGQDCILFSDIQALMPGASAVISDDKLVPFEVDPLSWEELKPKRVVVHDLQSLWQVHAPRPAQALEQRLDQLAARLDHLIQLHSEDAHSCASPPGPPSNASPDMDISDDTSNHDHPPAFSASIHSPSSASYHTSHTMPFHTPQTAPFHTPQGQFHAPVTAAIPSSSNSSLSSANPPPSTLPADDQQQQQHPPPPMQQLQQSQAQSQQAAAAQQRGSPIPQDDDDDAPPSSSVAPPPSYETSIFGTIKTLTEKLRLFESHIPNRHKSPRWLARRQEWLDYEPTSIEQVAYQLVQLEMALLWTAVTESWIQERETWLTLVASARTERHLAGALVSLERHTLTLDDAWQGIREEWLSDLLEIIVSVGF